MQEISDLLKASSQTTITEVVRKTEDDLQRAVARLELLLDSSLSQLQHS